MSNVEIKRQSRIKKMRNANMLNKYMVETGVLNYPEYI